MGGLKPGLLAVLCSVLGACKGASSAAERGVAMRDLVGRDALLQQAGGNVALRGASGLALASDGSFLTVLDRGGLGTVTLALATQAAPTRWRPVPVKWPDAAGCEVASRGPQWPELEAVAVDGNGQIALGSDLGFVAVGTLDAKGARVKACARGPELDGNAGFESVAWLNGSVLAIPEKADDAGQHRVYRIEEGVLASVGSFTLTSPNCSSPLRVTDADALGSGLLLISSCLKPGWPRSYAYFVSAWTEKQGSSKPVRLANRRTRDDRDHPPNLEGVIASCQGQATVSSDNSLGAERDDRTVLRQFAIPPSLLKFVGCP